LTASVRICAWANWRIFHTFRYVNDAMPHQTDYFVSAMFTIEVCETLRRSAALGGRNSPSWRRERQRQSGSPRPRHNKCNHFAIIETKKQRHLTE
jgi:hypothetical protein